MKWKSNANKQAYPECWNECSNPTIYKHKNMPLCVLSWEEQMHRKTREQSALKPEDTILLYSPGIRGLVRVNSVADGRVFPHPEIPLVFQNQWRECVPGSGRLCHCCQPAPGRKGHPSPPGAWSWRRIWPVTTGTPPRPTVHVRACARAHTHTHTHTPKKYI